MVILLAGVEHVGLSGPVGKDVELVHQVGVAFEDVREIVGHILLAEVSLGGGSSPSPCVAPFGMDMTSPNLTKQLRVIIMPILHLLRY